MEKYDEKFISRYWNKVDVGGKDACWEWQGATRNGYGVMGLNDTTINAHRVSLELNLGRELTEFALHECDNRKCCNPYHLYEGDRADNYDDWNKRQSNGDEFQGTNNPNKKLNIQDVKSIKEKFSDDYSTKTEMFDKIAREYDVTSNTIAQIYYGNNWQFVD